MIRAYYNEIDKYAAAWLRNLIAAGHIAPGDVDERSIEDVTPNDLAGYTQCHFFAGVGVWSYALRRAGWPDDRPVWTGSCPCQPFSAAGKGGGFADERHLWPAFHHLIRQRQPVVVFGEQVASKDADTWIDLVQTDLEALGYAVGAVPFPSAGVGAPHIRDRLYWVADTQLPKRRACNRGGATDDGQTCGRHESTNRAGECGELGRMEHRPCNGREQRGAEPSGRGVTCGCGTCWVGDNIRQGLAECFGEPGLSGGAGGTGEGQAAQRAGVYSCGLADDPSQRCREAGAIGGRPAQWPADGGATNRPRPTNGHWRDADWLYCRDGKWRPVEPGTFPLVNGAPARVGRLRAYGNAINAEAARVFVECYLDSFDN